MMIRKGELIVKNTFAFGFLFLFLSFISTVVCMESLVVNDEPARENEWGFRPLDGSTIVMTPPNFSWRPQKGAVSYQLQCSVNSEFTSLAYECGEITFNVHTPSRLFPAGKWYWRFRFTDGDGATSAWSQARSFVIAENAREMPLPSKTDLIERIPTAHPRLFVRPEQISEMQRRAQEDLKDAFDGLVKECEDIMREPPPTQEPPLYPEGIERLSEEWREIWWGNRVYTIRALNSAATLAFTRLLGGKDEYGERAKQILLECAEWNPKGATGYRYNDEAGMPYNYYLSRAYTFVHDLLSEAEREKCRAVMAVRGEEMYTHLCPRHLWNPYASHSNRAWHFLGEVGIAFLHEIPAAEQWVWFAANVFANVYPVWSDDDGGWHEGMSYWRSYINRFTWWADVMRVAMGINAFDKPYFSQIGYYPMYLQPPGTQGGGFGDLTARLNSQGNCRLMSIFAAQAKNPYWQWYVDTHGEISPEGGYIGFIRGALPPVASKPPTDLPSSRCFHGIGQAMMNVTLKKASDNVELIFKSSPFGTQSHGYEANNSFLLYAFGERLFIRSGRRDVYGSDHHKNWMWHTKSTNSITVNGETQGKRTEKARGEIAEFQTGPLFDYVCGEAGKAYGENLTQFTRRMLFIKPKVIVIFDTLVAPTPSSFEWRLHAPTEMEIRDQYDVRVVNGSAACRAGFLWPTNLTLTQTDRFDPPPRPRVQLVEYHLTAATRTPSTTKDFITVLQPYRSNQQLENGARLSLVEGGYVVHVPFGEGFVTVLLQSAGRRTLAVDGLETNGEVAAAVFNRDGLLTGQFITNDAILRVNDTK